MNLMAHLAFVAAGSALGGLARYGVVSGLMHFAGAAPHWATMLVNISGSFFLGWFITMLGEVWTDEQHRWIHAHAEEIRLLVAVGFTGGYTTFSSFEAETYRLLRDSMAWTAIVYVTASVFLGLIGFRLGMLVAGKG